MNGYNVLLPSSSRQMLPELALPAMDGLQQLGHTPVMLDMASMADLYREMRTKRHGGYELFLFYAKDIVAKGNIDFALSFGLSGILEDPSKEELHYLPEEFGLPGLLVFHRLETDAAAKLVKAGATQWKYTTVCCADAASVGALREAGLERVERLPTAYSPRVFYAAADASENAAYPLQLDLDRFAGGFDVSFAGTASPLRVELLTQVAEAGIRLAVYGNKAWETTPLADCFRGGVRRLEELNTVYNASAINLDLPAGADDAGDYVSSRVVEVLGSGGFLLALDQPGLADYAAAGSELAVCNAPEELAASIQQWLAVPDERAAIAAAGHARIQREATWQVRLKQALARLEVDLLSAAR